MQLLRVLEFYFWFRPLSSEEIEKKSEYAVSLALRKVNLSIPKELTQSLSFYLLSLYNL